MTYLPGSRLPPEPSRVARMVDRLLAVALVGAVGVAVLALRGHPALARNAAFVAMLLVAALSARALWEGTR